MLASSPERANGFTFWSAGGVNPVDTVVHPGDYFFDGPGGLTVTVGIDSTSLYAAEMAIPTQNVVNQWNWLTATTGNITTGAANTVPLNEFDFESVLLHEVGHALGLGHVNLADESGVPLVDQDYTSSTTGLNSSYDLNPGVDGIIGSADDVRGDDTNLHWFYKPANDPFDTPSPGVVFDSSTFSQNLADLPPGDLYAANGDRAVAASLGYANTEAVMQQGVAPGEMQRTLAADDVAGIRYGMSGTDELADTADDYWIDLQFVGQTTSADILISFNDGATPFAQTNTFVLVNMADNHKASYGPKVYFNGANYDWHFNDTLFTPMQGDVDLDGDVDNQDILNAFAHFTGPGTYGVTRSQGNVESSGSDRDVDVNDILTLFAAFTGPTPDEGGLSAPLGMTNPITPNLIYDPFTGEVILDPNGGVIRGYTLKSDGIFLSDQFSAALGGLQVATSFELSEAVFADGTDGITSAHSIGNVLPTGLSADAIANLLVEFDVSMQLGEALVPFQVQSMSSPVPEPTTFWLSLFGLIATCAIAAPRMRGNKHP